MRLLKAAAAAILLMVLVVLPPWALIRFIGNPWPPEGVSLSAPLTDGAIIGLLAIIVWVLWAQLMGCIAVELVCALSADRVQLQAPLTLGIQQQLARSLIAAVVLATVAGPVAMTSTALASEGPSPAEPTNSSPSTSQAHHHPDESQQERPREVTQDKAVRRAVSGPGSTVTVMRLDSLWSIAERVLGDGDRWPEIAALNEGHDMKDGTTFLAADHIRPGWTLRVPGEHTDQETNRADESSPYLVQAGDTLSEIADSELGDVEAWPRLYSANRQLVGPNPDLIHPGQVIVLPGRGGVADPGPEPGTRRRPAHGDNHATDGPSEGKQGGPGAVGGHGDESPADQDQSQTPATPATSTVPEQAAPAEEPAISAQQPPEPADADVAEADEAGGISALDALLASAVCLSAGALGLLLHNRRRQWRSRRIGRMIASTPDELVAVEQSIIEHGTATQRDAEFLDRALRYVAASCKVAAAPLPLLGAAVLGDEDLTLLFTQPAETDVPEGWTATDDSRAWMLPRWTILERELDNQSPPYPALVSVGLDEGGHTWYLDLESVGICGIGGDPHMVDDLARFMVAELAVNEWAEGCEVLLADEFAAETVRLNPARIRQVHRSDALARAAVLTGEMAEVEQNLGADVLTRRRDGLLLDTTSPMVVVVASRPDGDFVTAIESRDRSRVVVLHGDEESPDVELGGDGMAFLPRWGISVRAFTLQAEQAAPMADLITSTRNLNDEPIPAMATDDGPLGKYARADGSLREEYTIPRRTEGYDPSSMLPEADEIYLATAATTAEDLAAVAPSVPEEVSKQLADLDATLDQDLVDWYDESSPRPKVHLLGPVEVTALQGGDPSAVDNLRGTVSFIAYLAWLERGVTGERAAADCGWATVKTVQNRGTNARFLLGKRPDGSDWLPDAGLSTGALRGTTPTYELVKGVGGVLNSADLFVRLKHRAECRGDAGGCEEDLVKALALVTGTPFEGATEQRFKWLMRTGRPDDILAGAIHDAAHTLATRAVTQGRTDLVRPACEAARRANPNADVSWLDQAAATEAESGRAAAGELVRERVLDRFDEDLPARSETIVEQREWGATG